MPFEQWGSSSAAAAAAADLSIKDTKLLGDLCMMEGQPNRAIPFYQLVLTRLLADLDHSSSSGSSSSNNSSSSSNNSSSSSSSISRPNSSSSSSSSSAHHLIIDALYFPDAHSMHSSELWLTSLTPRINIPTFFATATHPELLALVTHLDPILQSSFFKKVSAFFPEHIEAVLERVNAIRYPEVISMLDAKHRRWGSNCTAAAAAAAAAD